MAISKRSYADGQAKAVVLARADRFPDALAGSPLAVAEAGPLLLTPGNELPPLVVDELHRVLPSGSRVFVLGGDDAISADIEASLRRSGYETTRLAGPSRVETSIAIADHLGAPGDLLITSGFAFPDAVAAGVAAAALKGAVLLTTADVSHPALDRYLERQGDAVRRYGVGGPAARAYPGATPVFGQTREATAVAVATAFFVEPSVLGLASRSDFPDALAGGTHIGGLGGHSC